MPRFCDSTFPQHESFRTTWIAGETALMLAVVRSAACEREHQLVQASDERRRVLELTAFGERRLIEQDVTPIGEPCGVAFVLQPLHDRMMRVDLEDRFDRWHRLPRRFQHPLEV